MCVSQQVRVVTGAAMAIDGDSTTQQLWARTAFRQPMKARLPRRLTTSARIDLNRHWSALEQLVKCTPPPRDAANAAAEADAEAALANAVNENLANERLEADAVALARRFVAVADQGATPGVRRAKDVRKTPVSTALMKLLKKLAK